MSATSTLSVSSFLCTHLRGSTSTVGRGARPILFAVAWGIVHAPKAHRCRALWLGSALVSLYPHALVEKLRGLFSIHPISEGPDVHSGTEVAVQHSLDRHYIGLLELVSPGRSQRFE